MSCSRTWWVLGRKAPSKLSKVSSTSKKMFTAGHALPLTAGHYALVCLPVVISGQPANGVGVSMRSPPRLYPGFSPVCGSGPQRARRDDAMPRARLTALRAAWLFDGVNAALIRDPVLVIEGGIISAVESGGPVPPDAEVVDLPGAALLPGLVDTHVHLAFDASAQPVANLGRRTDSEVIEAM